jgi:anaerobic magnesium-protoporphyrin IX monomethyl ester cyclase
MIGSKSPLITGHIQNLYLQGVSMNVCLVNPPLVTEGAQYVPLGIAYLAAVLRKDYNVTVVDGQCNPQNLVKAAQNADIVGITSISHNFLKALQIAESIKQENPETIVVMGGAHVTFTDIEILQNSCIDIVVRHEGEETMLDVINALQRGDLSGVEGITYKDKNIIKQNQNRPFIKDLDGLPFPARDLFDREYYYGADKVIQVISGRGCPFKCMFCSASSMWGHKVRLRSPKNVVDEIEQVNTVYNTDKFGFVDDTFTIVKKNTIKICEELLTRGLDIQWGCNVRVDTIDTPLVTLMKKAGCTRFFIGVESGNQKTLDFMHKNITVDQIKKAVSLAYKHDIKTTLSCILGMPNETCEDVKKTIDFMISLKGDKYIFNFLLLYPGTELYSRKKELSLEYVVDNPWEKVEKTPFPIPTVKLPCIDVRELSRLYLMAKAKLEHMKGEEY